MVENKEILLEILKEDGVSQTLFHIADLMDQELSYKAKQKKHHELSKNLQFQSEKLKEFISERL